MKGEINMLGKMNKQITITSESKIGDVVVMGFSANINSEDLENVRFSDWTNDNALYKSNRTECRKDMADFEDAVYLIQEKMISENTLL